MRRALIATLAVLAVAQSAWAIGFGREGGVFGRMGSSGKKGTPVVLVSCASTGVFNLGNTCNDIYFIGALR